MVEAATFLAMIGALSKLPLVTRWKPLANSPENNTYASIFRTRATWVLYTWVLYTYTKRAASFMLALRRIGYPASGGLSKTSYGRHGYLLIPMDAGNNHLSSAFVGGSAHVVLLSTRSKETCARRAQGPQLCPYLRWLHEHE
jgi:hypothetical protein